MVTIEKRNQKGQVEVGERSILHLRLNAIENLLGELLMADASKLLLPKGITLEERIAHLRARREELLAQLEEHPVDLMKMVGKGMPAFVSSA